MPYTLKSLVPITAEVHGPDGALVDASTTALTIQLPDGTTVTPTIARISVGHYELDYLAPVAGSYDWWFESTGPAAAAQGSFEVLPGFLDSIISLADAKAHLNKASGRTVDDAEILPFLRTATELVEEVTGEAVVRRSVVEVHHLHVPKSALMLRRTPVVSVTSVVAVDSSKTWDVSGLDLDGPKGWLATRKGAVLYGDIRATYVAGYAIVPARYSMAARMIVEHDWRSQRTQRSGSRRVEAAEQLVPLAGRMVPPEVAELLTRRSPGIA